jgi:hypothetical protein
VCPASSVLTIYHRRHLACIICINCLLLDTKRVRMGVVGDSFCQCSWLMDDHVHFSKELTEKFAWFGGFWYRRLCMLARSSWRAFLVPRG